MSNEQLDNHGAEFHPSPESEVVQQQNIEAKPDTIETAAPGVEEIRETIDKVEDTMPRPEPESGTENEATILPPPNDHLKSQTLNLTLRKTRQQLSKPAMAFSKVIHQPQVDVISDVTGKTIARPSGLLFGGLFALLGSLLYLYSSYHYHFTYKYIAFSLFFVGGFIIGLLIEFLGKVFKRNKTEHKAQ